MKGTILKRGQKWSVVIDMGRDASGKRIRKWHSGYERKRDAEAARVEILSRLQHGEYVSPSKLTVAAYLDHWLESRKNIADTTRATYRHEIRRVSDLLGPRQLLQLQPREIADAYTELLDRGLSAKSVRNSHGVLRKALSDAMRRGLVPRNVADGVELPRATKPDVTTWTASEAHTFLDHIEVHRLYAAWFVAVSTGMRRSEVLGLRWPNVDLDAGRLSAVDTLVMVDNTPVLRIDETKTAGSRRLIALDRATVAVLGSHRLRQLEERLAAGDVYTDRGLVFCNEIGDPVNPDWFTRTTKTLSQAAGVPVLTPHKAARHTWATLALEAGIPAKVVAERLGHASVSTTLDRYSHVIEGMDRGAAETVAALIQGGQR